jgi:hypothetical protein
MKKLPFLASFLGAFFGLAGTSISQTAPNSHFDDYAPAFRQLPGGGAELWFTSVMQSKSGRSRQMMVSRCTAHGFDTPVPLDDANINFIDPTRSAASDVLLNGVPSFTCDGTRGVFVSNRLVNGKDLGNDIYEMWQNADGHWQVQRIDDVNSDYWDDTPSLSADGNTLYFSSDRRHPGTKHTELFYARRSGPSSWSAPAPIDILDNAPGNHEAPCAGPDGYFYFTTNASGHCEIWRSPMKGGLPTTSGEPVSYPNVNSPTSDQTDPTFSPGGNWMLFTTNRADSGRTKDEDIDWVLLNPKPLTLSVNVVERLRLIDSLNPDAPADTTLALSTPVMLRDSASGIAVNGHSDAHGNCTLSLARGADPASDVALMTGLLSAQAPSTRFVSATDTLHYTQDARSDFDRTLFVWDTSSYYDPSCKQTFPIADVEFFIEGYWGPTTYKYRTFLQRDPLPSCPSFFTDSMCLAAQEHCINCQSNNLYGYEYDSTRTANLSTADKHQTTVHSVVYKTTRAEISDCFNYDEFRAHGMDYASQVDGALDNLKTSMQSALMRDCIVRAKRQKEKVEITVTGYTDPKKYRDQECAYSGVMIDFSKEVVHLIDSQAEPYFVNGTLMKIRGGGGNPLLSDLRAYWAAVLLDSIWNASVPAYQELRQMGLLVIKAEGKSVNPDAKRSLASQRSIAVEVKTEAGEVWKPGQKPQPGQVVDLWNQCATHNADGLSYSGESAK